MLPGADFQPAANTLRAWALDENLKARVLAHPVGAAMAQRVAARYTAGGSISDALAAASAINQRGHLASIEYAGESVRQAETARAEADVFADLARAATTTGLSAAGATVSFDLSHLGSLVDTELAAQHVRDLATALSPTQTSGGTRSADFPGSTLMISAEGSDRTDLVLDLYEQLAAEGLPVGITLQARLHRTPADLERVMTRPGRVRLVKGAFLEEELVAHRRDSPELMSAYLDLARRLVTGGHPVSLATHDAVLVEELVEEHGEQLLADARLGGVAGVFEFEMLMGLGTQLLDRLREQGYRTREYVVFGPHWWLYVLNRIAEQPERVSTALADLGPCEWAFTPG